MKIDLIKIRERVKRNRHHKVMSMDPNDMMQILDALDKRFEDWRDQYEENVRHQHAKTLYENRIEALEKEMTEMKVLIKTLEGEIEAGWH